MLGPAVDLALRSQNRRVAKVLHQRTILGDEHTRAGEERQGKNVPIVGSTLPRGMLDLLVALHLRIDFSPRSASALELEEQPSRFRDLPELPRELAAIDK